MKMKKLNEDYLDSAEFKIQRYEDDIPELMHRLHDGYMSGMVNARAYAEALRRVFAALEEIDYVDEDANEGLLDGAVNAVSHPMNISKKVNESSFDEIDDDFDDLSVFDNSDDVNRMDLLYNGEKNHRLSDLSESSEARTPTEKELEKALKTKRLKLNPAKNNLKAAAEYIDMGGKDYSVDQWIEDTKKNYPDHFLKESNSN